MTGSAEQAPAGDLVAAGLRAVRARIVAAAEAVGRDPAEVTLVAVSKAQPDARVQAALGAGQRVFGENYVQEAKARWPALRARWPDLRLHMIGLIHTNTAKDALAPVRRCLRQGMPGRPRPAGGRADGHPAGERGAVVALRAAR